MKTMNRLMSIATELHEFYAGQLDDRTEYIVITSLDCGEQGLASVELVEWAIRNDVAIPDKFWSALMECYSSETAYGREYALQKLAEVKHAA